MSSEFDQKMTAVADRVRRYTGETSLLSLDLLPDAVDRVYSSGGGSGSYEQGYSDGFRDGEDQGYDNGYTDGWDSGESSGTHDGFEVGVGFDESTKSVVVFSGYQSDSFDGSYELTIDNPKKLIVTVSTECLFSSLELMDAEGTTHTLDVQRLDAGTHTFDFPDYFVCNADDGYGEVYLEGSCTDYGIVGVSVTNKLSYNEGVEAGRQDEYDAFWDEVQQNGTRTVYDAAFFAGRTWTDARFKPKYPITFRGNTNYLFYNTGINNMIQCIENAGVSVKFEGITGANQMFSYSRVTHLPHLDFSEVSGNLGNTCSGASQLRYIEEISVGENTGFSGTFDGCNSLEHAIFTGVIAKNGLNVSACPLDHESLMSIIYIFKDFSGTGETRSATFGATNLAKLTDAEKAIATQKGWTLL